MAKITRRQQRPSANDLGQVVKNNLLKPVATRKPTPGYGEPRQMAPGYGNPVTPTQRPNTDIVPKEPLPQLVRGKDGKMVPYVPGEGTGATQEERIQAEMDRPYTEQAQTEEELFGTATTSSSLREEINRQNEKLRQETERSMRQADAQTASINEQARQGEQAIANAQDQINAIDVGRNGPVSRSNAITKKGFTTEMGKRLDYLTAQKDEQLAQVEDFMAKAREAEAAGRSDLAAQFRTQAIQAENTITQIDTDYLNSLAQKDQEARASLASFQSLVETGATLTPDGIANLATTLNLPFETLNAFYEGADVIRNDKNMSLEEKAIANKRNALLLQNELNGVFDADQRKVAFLQQMRLQGASPEDIAAYKQIAGITDYDDPLTQAELEYKQLENEIKRKQMAGEPTSIAEMEALFDLRQKIDAQAGTGGTAYVSPSIDGISMSYEGGGLNVTLPRNADGSLKAYQCGEFVNRAWGIPKGGVGGFGDTIGDKMGVVDKNGFRVGSMSPVEIASSIVPGMAFVSEAGETGHVGLIVSGVDDQGNFQTLEANVGDNNPYVSDPPIYKTRNIKDLDLKGFAYPPNGAAVGGEGDYLTSSLANSAGGAKVPVEQLNALVKSFDSVNQVQYLTELFNKDKTVGLDGSKIDLSPITGWLQSKNPWDADAQTINAILTGTVPTVARGIFGEVGVLTDADVALYKQVLPNLTQTDEVKALVSAALLRTVKNGLQNRLEILANSGYDVSGLAPKYNMLASQIAQIEGELGVNAGQPQEQTQVDLDAELYANGGYNMNEQKQSLWDALENFTEDFINNIYQ